MLRHQSSKTNAFIASSARAHLSRKVMEASLLEDPIATEALLGGHGRVSRVVPEQGRQPRQQAPNLPSCVTLVGFLRQSFLKGRKGAGCRRHTFQLHVIDETPRYLLTAPARGADSPVRDQAIWSTFASCFLCLCFSSRVE